MNTPCIYRLLNSKIKTTFLFVTILLFIGCEEFLEVDDPTGQISHEKVFEDEITATAAVTTMYAKLRDEVLLTGTNLGLGVQMGLYADELDFYGPAGQYLEPFYRHQIIASDIMVSRVWSGCYNLIYLANSAIEGLEISENLNEEVRNQLLGEAIFIRALTHFYLVNIYGGVPYIKTTNYEINKQVSRMPENLVYNNIIDDLTKAKQFLSESYVSAERIRANKYVASALLSRVYLYIGQWENAETESSLIIDNSSVYNLESNLDNEFLKTSRSAILQLKTKIDGLSTTEATTLSFTSGPPPLIALSEEIVEIMEDTDLRKTHWIGEVVNGANRWYYSSKYKQNTGLQYSVAFRLAEQYLIRSESRFKQNDFVGALNDLNIIRLRAGLEELTDLTPEELFEAIVKERRLEMFMEHGHRWFDIKRLGIMEEVLSGLKPNLKITDDLLPIPESELLMNQNLNPQNAGY